MWYLRMVSRRPMYSGLSTFMNSARAQIMNIWPIFCSSDIFFSDSRAHFSPFLSRWTGPGC